MIIVNTSDETKQISYFNRLDLTPVTISITNESTNVNTSIDIDSLMSLSYYDVLTITFDSGYFIQDNFYFFQVLDIDNKILFQDKIFCTDYTENYSINEGRYKENETTNEYKIYR